MRENPQSSQSGALALAGAALVLLGTGCRGQSSGEPPIHLQRNMFTQDKGKPQRENPFFADHRTQRAPVEGTVTIAAADPTDPVQTGLADGAPVKKMPVPLTMDLMLRGQNRFNIYCAPCHDRTGGGNGLVIQHAAGSLVHPPPYNDQRLLAEADGYFFGVVTNGVRTMPGYGTQVPVEDRWAIVAYVRALQRSTSATLADVPKEMRSNLP